MIEKPDSEKLKQGKQGSKAIFVEQIFERCLNSSGKTRKNDIRQSTNSIARLLIVDDEEAIRNLLKRMLSHEGYECETAPDAECARSLLDRHVYNLLLCDIRMPGESGLDLCRFVKSAFPEMGIVMVTVIDSLETARQALDLDIYGYIIKPVDRSQILIGVANALRRQQLELAAKTARETLEKMVYERTAQLVKANKILEKNEAELKERAEEYEDLNNALRVLLKKREEDKNILGDRILTNIKKIMIPNLERLQKSRLSPRNRHILDLIQTNIEEITSPFVKSLSSAYIDLSPNEIQVADLIRQGKHTKEIAAIMNLSENTIMTHRFHIRTKLGLKNKKTNLQTFLTSIG